MKKKVIGLYDKKEWKKTIDLIQTNFKKKVAESQDLDLGIPVPEDIKITLYVLFDRGVKDRIAVKGPEAFIGNNSIFELLKGSSSEGYTIQEGQELVRYYLYNYWWA